MNQKIKFGTIICISVFLLIYILYSIHEKPFLEKIDDFEDKYKLTINALTDSLMKRKDLDTTYVMEWRRGFPEDLFFYYLDSTGKMDNYFKINFNLSKEQIDFFSATASGGITYLKKYHCFQLKPFYFKTQNTTLLLVIDKNIESKYNSIIELEKIFQQDNYSYYLTNAF